MSATAGTCGRLAALAAARPRPPFDDPTRPIGSSAAQVGLARAPLGLRHDLTLTRGPSKVRRRADALFSTGDARGAQRRAPVASRPCPLERASAASAPGAPCPTSSTLPSFPGPPSTAPRRDSRPRAHADATRTRRAARRPTSASRSARPGERARLDARRAHALRGPPWTALDRRDALAFLSRTRSHRRGRRRNRVLGRSMKTRSLASARRPATHPRPPRSTAASSAPSSSTPRPTPTPPTLRSRSAGAAKAAGSLVSPGANCEKNRERGLAH